MTICLAAIVRDEAHQLVRCLDAAARVADRVVLVDTGSEDDTIRVARAWAHRTGVELVLREEPWQNFRENRTSLLRHAEREADWILMLDADLVVHAPDPLPDLDAADCWQGRIGGGLSYTLPFLIRAGKPWRYEGVAHSYLACDEDFTEAEMPGLWVEDYSHTGPEKLRRDLDALSAEHARDPLDPRTAFYLAQTYYDLDMVPEAIQAYRVRAHLGGWDEETYYARYRLGTLLCEHVDFREGARELLAAWEIRPSRAEALRVLSNVAANVADKIPYPADRLFVTPSAYAQPAPETVPAALPPFPEIAPTRPRRRPRRTRRRGLDVRDVSAVLVTRGNVDVGPVLAPVLEAGITDVVVWDNSKRDRDYRAFGRYAAIPETRNPVVYWVDDDVRFTAFDELLAAYEPGRLVCNMDDDWVDGAGYRDLVGMQGAGSLCDADLPARVWASYLAAYPWDEEALVEADFVFGVLCPFRVVDLGYETFPYTDDADRLYRQENQTARKWAMIERCRTMLAAKTLAEATT